MLERPILVTYIALCLLTPSIKLRCLTADLLAALCVISPNEGQPLVLAAMSEFRMVFDESFRFEWLIASLDPAAVEPDGLLWEWRTSILALLNAVVNAPDSPEFRCEIRGELLRRGLTHAIEVRDSSSSSAYRQLALQQHGPPATFVIQARIYAEETDEDSAALRNLNLEETYLPLTEPISTTNMLPSFVDEVDDLRKQLMGSQKDVSSAISTPPSIADASV